MAYEGIYPCAVFLSTGLWLPKLNDIFVIKGRNIRIGYKDEY